MGAVKENWKVMKQIFGKSATRKKKAREKRQLPKVPDMTAEDFLHEPRITSKTSMGHLRTTKFSLNKEPKK